MIEDGLLFQDRYRICSTRLNGWDYGDAGMYFVTICTKHKIPWFGEIRNGYVGLSEIGSIIHQYWAEIPMHFPHVTLDRYIVMPDHVHGILFLNKPTCVAGPFVETSESDVSTNTKHPQRPSPGSLGSIINQFKSVCTKRIRTTHPDFAWQPRFHDRVIRNRNESIHIRKYIADNPSRWAIKHQSSD